MNLERISLCPICDGKKFSQALTTKDFTATGETFAIELCEQCGFHLTNPRPNKEQINKYYQAATYTSHTASQQKGLINSIYKQARQQALKQKQRLIESHHQTTTLLDYGCGTGSFLQHMQTNKWDIKGVEPSTNARQQISKNIKVFSQLEEIEDTFQVITLWHVLEHVHDLNQTLEGLKERLQKDGTIFIAVPNRDAPDARYYKNKWAAWDVPRHLWHFNKADMINLLAKHKLQLKSIVPMKMDAYYVSLLSEKYSGKNSILAPILGAWYGLLSNTHAGKDNYSSLIYIAGK